MVERGMRLLWRQCRHLERRGRSLPHAGVKSVFRLFDELVKCDEEGILKGVRKVIEGK